MRALRPGVVGIVAVELVAVGWLRVTMLTRYAARADRPPPPRGVDAARQRRDDVAAVRRRGGPRRPGSRPALGHPPVGSPDRRRPTGACPTPGPPSTPAPAASAARPGACTVPGAAPALDRRHDLRRGGVARRISPAAKREGPWPTTCSSWPTSCGAASIDVAQIHPVGGHIEWPGRDQPTGWPSSPRSPTCRPSPPATDWFSSTPGRPSWPATVHETLRRWSTLRLDTAIYSHGHIDHVFGVPVFEQEAAERGWPMPVVVAHDALPARFDRYIFTAGYNEVINQRQFGVPGLRWPTSYRYPDRTYADRLSLEVGGVAFELHHARGETDDHTWTWVAEKKVLCSGDLFIWASPNAGNPQKVQRYPREWAVALREMVALGPEVLLPGHGFPVLGADRVRQALTDTADLLDSLVDQTLALMNAGARLDEILHTVAAPAAPARPALSPSRLRRAGIHRPQHLAPLRGLVGRQSGHLEAGPRERPGRRAGRPGRRRLGPGRPGPGAGRVGRPAGAERAPALRVAAHLAELAALAAPADPGVAQGAGQGLHPVRRGGHLDHGEGRLQLGRAGVRRARRGRLLRRADQLLLAWRGWLRSAP